MRFRVLAPVLIAGMAALALPFSSEAASHGHGGGGHSSGGHSSGGHSSGGHSSHGHSSGGHTPGGHSGSGGHSGHGGHGGPGHPGGGPHGGYPHHGGGYYGRHGFFGWGGLYLSFPLWWDAYSWWGLPYGYYGAFGYYPYYGDDGYADSGDATVPASPEWGGSDAATRPSAASGSSTAPAQGTSPVELEVSPPSALVFLNGVLVGSVDEFGRGSDFLYLDAGAYTLEFRAPGFHTRTLKLNVSGGNKTVVGLDLQLDPAAGAERAAPPSPGLPHGRRFTPSFSPATSQPSPQTDLGGGAVRGIAAAPGSTALVLHVSPLGAAVYVDGTLLGTGEQLAQLQQGIAVSPGPHRVDVVAPGHAGKTLQVDTQAGKSVELAVALD